LSLISQSSKMVSSRAISVAFLYLLFSSGVIAHADLLNNRQPASAKAVTASSPPAVKSSHGKDGGSGNNKSVGGNHGTPAPVPAAGKKQSGSSALGGDKSGGGKQDNGKAAGDKSGSKSVGSKSSGDKSGGDKSAGNKSGGNQSGGNKSGDVNSGDVRASNSTSGGGQGASSKSGSSDKNLQTSQTLDPSVIASGFAKANGNATDNQANSLTSTNNFINFCVGQTTITNGLQVSEGSCNPAPMGDIPASSQMPSAKFQFPKNFGTVPANQAFTISMAIKNLASGNFTDASNSYFAAPQQLNGQGLAVGHSHVVVESIDSLTQTTPTDPNKFAFFKGLNDVAVNGVLTANVTEGLPAGTYRLASINTAANHQPVLVPIAQHGSLDDFVYFTVTDGSNGSGNNGAGNKGGGNNGTGNNGAGNNGAGNNGAVNKGAGNNGAVNKGAGGKGAGNKGTSNNGGKGKRRLSTRSRLLQ
jgi:hypothetical protein